MNLPEDKVVGELACVVRLWPREEAVGELAWGGGCG